MRVTKFYISSILEEIAGMLIGISENVTAGNRKSVSQEQMEDFIVVSFPVNIPENKVVQNTTVRFDLAARNTVNGLEDTPKLQSMLDVVITLFPIHPSLRYTVTNPTVVLKGDDGLGFSHWLINADIQINQTDSYKY